VNDNPHLAEAPVGSCLPSTFKGPGIYGIRHDASGRVYIGSSKNVSSRLRHHFGRLQLKNHRSRHLQRAWNKYGPEAFTVILLETVVAGETLVEREQFWLDYFHAYTKGFNSRPKAESPVGAKWTEAQKKKLRGYRRGVWTPSSHRKVSDTLKLRHAEKPEWRKRIQEWRRLPENEAKRLDASKRALKRPEIYRARVQQLGHASKSRAKLAAIRRTYFEKFNRTALGFSTTEEMDQACFKLYSEGKSCRAIGRLFNIDHHGISSRLRRLGVSTRRNS